MKTKTCRLFRLTLAVSLMLALTACLSSKTAAPLTPITVQLQWTHQAEFAGFYAADQNGMYAKEGLKVTFLQGGPEVDSLASVVGGKAQFGTASADQLIVARVGGQPLRAIAAVYRRSPTVFFSLASSGITRPQDFAGKTIRTTSTTSTTLHAMTAFTGVTADKYTEVLLPSDVDMFLTGDVPIWSAFATGLLIPVQQTGARLNIIYPDDYGIHFYGDTIITTDNLAADNPDLVLRFLRASLKGWTYAVENPGKASAMVAKYEPGADLALETIRMTTSLPLINTGEDHIGWMKPEIWAGMEQVLREQSMLPVPVDVRRVYTTQFLEQIYQ